MIQSFLENKPKNENLLLFLFYTFKPNLADLLSSDFIRSSVTIVDLQNLSKLFFEKLTSLEKEELGLNNV